MKVEMVRTPTITVDEGGKGRTWLWLNSHWRPPHFWLEWGSARTTNVDTGETTTFTYEPATDSWSEMKAMP